MTKRLGWAIALAALILAAAGTLSYLESNALIEADIARRSMQVLIGLMLTGYANVMPKQLDRLRGSIRAQAAAQAAVRVGGWSLTLGGLAYAGLWAFAPLDVANTASIVVVAGATLLTVGYSIWCFATCRSERGASAGR
ncbi:hypothetical protein N0B44_30235 [Roseibacterium beibuensis]|uniref:hypothetical protein n=1 Tax=[Roseibacterium] beibuensis TaxID=1193142 RepID=UPI00217E8F15|nr:hypothetical protein [Roseibacterium beibuensis]MCS6627194.1 hypothetical protein [Roseibacterium beibuensis]